MEVEVRPGSEVERPEGVQGFDWRAKGTGMVCSWAWGTAATQPRTLPPRLQHLSHRCGSTSRHSARPPPHLSACPQSTPALNPSAVDPCVQRPVQPLTLLPALRATHPLQPPPSPHPPEPGFAVLTSPCHYAPCPPPSATPHLELHLQSLDLAAQRPVHHLVMLDALRTARVHVHQTHLQAASKGTKEGEGYGGC